ncbi:MAG: hypothetical protein Q7U74_01700, partial [Saprospiraceae bacterium]|nr:hypothetical protein [Saprospiraceae bacterium]
MNKILNTIPTIVFLCLLSIGTAFSQSADDLKLMIPAGHNKYISELALSGDERLLASMSDEGFKIWDVASGAELITVPISTANGNMPFRIGNTPHIGMISRGVVSVLDGKTLKTRRVVDLTQFMTPVAVTTDLQGKFAYLGGHNYNGGKAVVVQINLATGAQKTLLEVAQSRTTLSNVSASFPFAFQKLSLSPDGSKLSASLSYYAGVADKIGYNVVFINTLSGQVEKQLDVPGNQTFIFLSNNRLAHFGAYFMKEGQGETDLKNSIPRLVSYPEMRVLKTLSTPTIAAYTAGNYGHTQINSGDLSYANILFNETFKRVVRIDFNKGEVNTEPIATTL